MSVLKKFKDFMGLNNEEYEDYDTDSALSADGGAVGNLVSMPYSHIQEVMIDNIVLDLHAIDLRIQEYQEEIDSLKADTKKMIANLTLIIK